jgi:hypothetical protein
MVLKAALSIQCWSRPESVFRFNPDVAALGLTRIKLQRNGFDFIFLDRIYRIDGIFFAFGEEPFRLKAVLS